MTSRLACTAGGLAALGFTALVTWPQAAHLADRAAAHQDTYFSMWRLEWIAHALRSAPSDLFSPNIFHPLRGTLAYSDAMLLEGLVAAPLSWAGVPPVLTYNLMLFAGFAGSGLAMFVLAYHLTRSMGPSLVAAAVFTMAPYRIEHFMHLELQWMMWLPLTFWALHRAVEEESRRWGAAAGVFLWLQVLSCVYYGVFLAVTLAVFVPVLLIASRRRGASALVPVVIAAGVAAALTVPYAWPYLQNARALGPREPAEILRYSAAPIHYAASPPQNLLWGWTARWGGPELSLFPGLTAVVLAGAAAWFRPRRLVWLYGSVAAVAVMLSFGMHSPVYRFLGGFVPLLGGLRSPSRFDAVVMCAVAVLAGMGAAAVARRWGTPRTAGIVLGALIALLCLEYANTGMHIAPIADGPYDVYTMMRRAGGGVVAELPMPRAGALPGNEQMYAFWSRAHWQPLVNGYSGYYPVSYVETVSVMERFPDDRSIARLRRLGVRWVILHRSFYTPQQVTMLLVALAARPELRHSGTFSAPSGPADLFSLAAP